MGSVDPVLSIGSTARFTVNSASSPVLRAVTCSLVSFIVTVTAGGSKNLSKCRRSSSRSSKTVIA